MLDPITFLIASAWEAALHTTMNTPIPEIALVPAPELRKLPTFIEPSDRFNLERQRLIEASVALRSIEHHYQMALWAEWDAACKLVEDQIAAPFRDLVKANEARMAQGLPPFLDSSEEDELRHFERAASDFRKANAWPQFDEFDSARIAQYLALWPRAIAAARRQDASMSDIIEAALLDVAGEPVRG